MDYTLVMRNPNCKCKICNKAIYRRPKQIKLGNVYCSHACVGLAQQKEKTCPICNKHIKTNNITCSRSCANKYRKHTKGTNRAKLINTLKTSLALLTNGKCQSCGNINYNILQVHHIIPRSKGGTNDLNNLQLLCPNCHMTIHYGYNLWRTAEVSIPIPEGTASFQD